MPFRNSLVAAWAALFAILSMAAIPQGMMPVWGIGGFSIELCSPIHKSSISVDRSDPGFETLRIIERAKRIAQGSLDTDSGKEATSIQCEFAANSAKAALIESAGLPAANRQVSLYGPQTRLNLVIAQRLHLPPSTGPPTPL